MVTLFLLSIRLVAFQPVSTPPDDLTSKIMVLDSELFDAYNKCDLPKFSSFLSEDLEFYHDETGLSVGRQATVQAVKNNVCGKVHRYLIPGTAAVYPLKGYGAVEMGIHLFCSPKSLEQTGKCGDGSGVARFTHLWKNENGIWSITRVISYDHCNGCSTSVGPEYRITKPN